MFRDTVSSLLEECLVQRQDLFLIDFDILEGSKIRIVIDGDKGVLVEDCMFVSRAIEHNLDREEQDFSLEVSSAGAESPLTHYRQYLKHIGRVLKVKASNRQTYEAKLTSVNTDSIRLEWKTREPKPIGKGKQTVSKNIDLSYSDIEQAKVKLLF